MPIGNASLSVLAGLLKAIVLNGDGGWAPRFWNLPRYSQVPLAPIQSDSAVKETDRREWPRAESERFSFLASTANRASNRRATLALVLWLVDSQ